MEGWIKNNILLVCYIQEDLFAYMRESLNNFPDFFRMGTFIDSTHMKL